MKRYLTQHPQSKSRAKIHGDSILTSIKNASPKSPSRARRRQAVSSLESIQVDAPQSKSLESPGRRSKRQSLSSLKMNSSPESLTEDCDDVASIFDVAPCMQSDRRTIDDPATMVNYRPRALDHGELNTNESVECIYHSEIIVLKRSSFRPLPGQHRSRRNDDIKQF